jgi:hypothetical protein
MTRRRQLGILLIAAALLAGAVLWALGAQAVVVGPATVVSHDGMEAAVGKGAWGSSESVVVAFTLFPNGRVILPLALLAVVGVVCLVAPMRRGNHQGS